MVSQFVSFSATRVLLHTADSIALVSALIVHERSAWLPVTTKVGRNYGDPC